MGVKLANSKKFNVPAPGAYDQSSKAMNKTFSYSMGAKLKGSMQQNMSSTPGPGSYDCSGNSAANKGPKYGFGSGSKLASQI